MATLRTCSWLPRTAIVIADLVEKDAPVRVAPRSILRQQVKLCEERGLNAVTAAEVEYYLYEQSYRSAHETGYNNLKVTLK